MNIPQSTYGAYQDAGQAGMLYDTDFRDVMSYSAVGAVKFGGVVKLGTNPATQVSIIGTDAGEGAKAVGIAVASASVEAAFPFVANAVTSYPATVSVPVLKRGRVWVETNDAVVAGASANLHLATGKFTDEAVAAGIEAFTQFKATFITGTSGAGLAVLEIK
jgi:hypothetical protein